MQMDKVLRRTIQSTFLKRTNFVRVNSISITYTCSCTEYFGGLELLITKTNKPLKSAVSKVHPQKAHHTQKMTYLISVETTKFLFSWGTT